MCNIEGGDGDFVDESENALVDGFIVGTIVVGAMLGLWVGLCDEETDVDVPGEALGELYDIEGEDGDFVGESEIVLVDGIIVGTIVVGAMLELWVGLRDGETDVDVPGKALGELYNIGEDDGDVVDESENDVVDGVIVGTIEVGAMLGLWVGLRGWGEPVCRLLGRESVSTTIFCPPPSFSMRSKLRIGNVGEIEGAELGTNILSRLTFPSSRSISLSSILIRPTKAGVGCIVGAVPPRWDTGRKTPFFTNTRTNTAPIAMQLITMHMFLRMEYTHLFLFRSLPMSFMAHRSFLLWSFFLRPVRRR